MNKFFSNSVKSLEKNIKRMIELYVKKELDGKGDNHYILLDSSVEVSDGLYVYYVRLIDGDVVFIDEYGKEYNVEKMYYNEFPLQAMAQIADQLFETKYAIYEDKE